MQSWISKRMEETGLPNPIQNQEGWHGKEGVGYFETSQQAYDALHIGSAAAGAKLQARTLSKNAKD